jgi:hydroxymethylpyrimidine pyrophosphatase-like HAD family hydrolase
VLDPMKRLIVFDLDGTLAESKSSLDAEMAALLSALYLKSKFLQFFPMTNA